ncbi:MAG: helix-turn-helix transcriptional regulator [Xanthobacteraceae bacterium]
MLDPSRIDTAIDGLYDAAVANRGWADALHGLARAADAVCSRFYPRQRGHLSWAPAASHDYQPFLDEFVRDGWWRSDHRAVRGWAGLAGGRRVLIDHDVASDEERQTLPQYRELYRRYDVPWWAAVSFEVNGALWAVPFLRSAKQGPFTREEAKSLLGLAPHLERIHRLSRLALDASAGSALMAFERLGCPAALLKADRTIWRHNAALEDLLGPLLQMTHRRLTALDRANDARLQAHIDAALSVAAASHGSADPAVLRQLGTPSILVDAFPIANLLADAFGETRALLIFTDLSERRAPRKAALRASFGLTPAEVRLAAMVACGFDLTDIARRFGVSKGTARAQLKSVFAKTGTNRQADLVAALATFRHVET